MKYIKGEGVAKDLTVGKLLLEKSAAQGNEEAKAELTKLASTASATTSTTQTNAPTK